MSDKIYIQYVGFEPKPMVREYTFQVLGGGVAREFTLTIANEAFLSRRARFQDGPDICTVRLRQELTADECHPSKTQFRITETELDDYRGTHLPKSLQDLFSARARKLD